MIRFMLFALLLIVPSLAFPGSLLGADLLAKPYAAAGQVDLVRLLPPPPKDAETRVEIQAMLRLQKRRTAVEEQACRDDQVISVFRFADVLGGKFTPEAIPKTKAFFDRVLASSRGPVDKAKDHWARPRPPQADPRVKPCVKLPLNASYPSGHSTAGNLMATLLAGMLPEKSAEIFARGRLFGDHRVLGGVHFPSDVDAGRLCAAALAQALYQDAEFRADFDAARAETRAALGFQP